MSYQDRYQKLNFQSFEELFADENFKVHFGEKRIKDIEPILEFINEKIGNLQEKKILDLGGGYGSLAIPLSGKCRKILVTDINNYALESIKYVVKQKNIKNLSTKHFDVFNSSTLPFMDKSFDLVIVNGMLEYAGMAQKREPLQTQQYVLNELNRVLTDFGYLYWAIENRFSFNYFYSKGHDGMYFSSLLPRPIAQIYSRTVKKKKYEFFEPSYFLMKKLLHNAGFKHISFFCGMRSYNHPKIIMDLTDREKLKRNIDKFS